MRFFCWTVESFLQVHNPPNATPIVIEKISEQEFVSRSNRLTDRRQTLQARGVTLFCKLKQWDAPNRLA
jgi:hypothetical protein